MMSVIPVMPPTRRQSVRRAVELDCDVRSDRWNGPLPLAARDISPEGLWLASPFALDPGEQLVLAFRPPRWPVGCLPVVALGEVVRADMRRRRSDGHPPGMGVRFLDIAHADQTLMQRSLRGLPPPLPPRPRPEPLARIDAEACFTLDDGERVAFRTLAPLLTHGRPSVDGASDESTLPSALRLAG
jgi:hypothetical protein